MSKLKSITHIQKRDGRRVKFDPGKITQAIYRALMATHDVDGEKKSLAEAKRLTPIAVDLFARTTNGQPPHVETMQDVVEQVLMAAGHYKTAKAYILYRAEHKQARKVKEIIGVEDDLGLSLNQLKVMERRYLRHNEEGKVVESPRELFERVARAIAANEKKQRKTWEQKFLAMLTKLEFLPGGAYLRAAGFERGMLANCFVLPVEDSMEGIFNAVKWMALVHQAGGGTGFNFSKLRPKGDFVVRSGGFSSGPISFMKVFDAATRQVMQGGFRKGANMGILNVNHPDIFNFISCKTEEHEVNNFNISVGASDQFMKAVEKNADFDLVNQRTGEVVQTISARALFDQIVTLAWRTGDPGMIYLDAINRANPVIKTLGPMTATNPCIAGDMLISTDKGLIKMENLNHKKLQIVSDLRVIDGYGIGIEPITAFYDQGGKETYRIITKSGFELVATADHKIMTTNGWVEAKSLTSENKVLIQSAAGQFSIDYNLDIPDGSKTLPIKWSQELGQVLGWLVGDGWLRSGDKNCRVGFVFGEEDKNILDWIQSIINQWYGKRIMPVLRKNGVHHLSYHGRFFVDFFEKLGVKAVKADEKTVPESLFTAPREAVIGFLQALFTADGTVGIEQNKRYYYARLTSKSKTLLRQVQLLLLNLGIKANIYDRSRPERLGFAYRNNKGENVQYRLDGKLWELNITKANLKVFVAEVGFLLGKHQKKLEIFKKTRFKKETFTDSVLKIEKVGKINVYDLTAPKTHSFIANGFVISNCGEQPLHPFDVCNLGSINLSKFVKADGLQTTDYGKKAVDRSRKTVDLIDWRRLGEATRLAVRFLDNGVDVSTYPIEQITNMAKANRRIGLGIMGWADMLYQLGVAYNSKLAFRLAEQVMRRINDAAHDESEKLAQEKGVFPNWKGSTYQKRGRKQRNVALTTIAPTGTISMVADCSSGIEPTFALSYVKNVVDEQGLVYVNPYFRDVLEQTIKDGHKRQEILDQVAKTGSCQNIPGLPKKVKEIFVTAHDMGWEDHVRMQAAFQKHTDNAVSKTINFPNSATIDEISQAYLLAWKLGCKGITIYRDGSKRVQILSSHEQEETPAQPVIQSKVQIKPLKQRIKENGQDKQESCPECGGLLQVSEGCSTCLECGFSKCSL